MLYTFTIHHKPPPTNGVYKIRRDGKGMYTTPKGVEFKEFVTMSVRAQNRCAKLKLSDDEGIVARYIYVSPKMFLKGKKILSKTKGDVDGLDKLMQDAMCTALGVDDYLILNRQGIQVGGEGYAIHIQLKIVKVDDYMSIESFKNSSAWTTY